jgi:hypothetical protein
VRNVKATPVFPGSLAGAAIPIPTLVLRSDSDPSLSQALENQADIVLVDRDYSAEAMSQLSDGILYSGV